MKHKFLWSTIFIIMFILQGCLSPKFNVGESINAPKNNSIPIMGTWKFSDAIYSNSTNKIDKKISSDSIAQFTEDTAIINSNICKNPNYKVKLVNTDDYFLYTYKMVSKDLNIESDNIVVITITSDNKLFYELVKINDNKLLININETFYYLNKNSDETNTEIENDVSNKNSVKNIKEDSLIDSGILLGIKEESKNITQSPSKYKTLWIESHNNKLSTILQSDNLFLPRKSGFWEIKSKREVKNNFVQDKFYASQIDIDIKKETNIKPNDKATTEPNNTTNDKLSSTDKSNNSIKNKLPSDTKKINQLPKKDIKKHIDTFYTNIYRNINFIGNDYLCSEYSTNSEIKSNTLDKFQVLPIDNLQNTKGLTITNIIGKNAYKIFMDSAESFLSTYNEENLKNINQVPSQDNFTLIRENGQWIMEGRLNSIDKSDTDVFENFTINLFPPKKMVTYDELYVSWNDVKSRVPSATDVLTSPNKDIALIISKNKIYIYSIKSNHLDASPLKEINIKENESIIMTEWATGSYVKNWSGMFKNYIKSNKNNE